MDRGSIPRVPKDETLTLLRQQCPLRHKALLSPSILLSRKLSPTLVCTYFLCQLIQIPEAYVLVDYWPSHSVPEK
jgi:hypothetical protein